MKIYLTTSWNCRRNIALKIPYLNQCYVVIRVNLLMGEDLNVDFKIHYKISSRSDF